MADPGAGTVKIDRYDIVGQLGSGGMGAVYLGRMVGPGGFERLVAIKTIHPHLASRRRFVEMFLDEARLAARLRHPNIVPVYEVGEFQGRYYLAMEYVSGEVLNRVISRMNKAGVQLPFHLAAHLGLSVSEALHTAHGLVDSEGLPLGAIHRDISPKNLIIGYDGVLRVIDFGVAKAKDQLTLTHPGTLRGTVAYMAPEQVLGRSFDQRVDLFSLGVVLWEATVRRRLFRGTTDLATADKIRDGVVPRPSTLRENFPKELERIILRALEPNPDRRYSSARELGLELRAFLEQQGRHVVNLDVEAFMLGLFPDRKRERQAMETAAAMGVLEPNRVAKVDDEGSRTLRARAVRVPPTEVRLPVPPSEEEVSSSDTGPLLSVVEAIAPAADALMEDSSSAHSEAATATQPKIRRPLLGAWAFAAGLLAVAGAAGLWSLRGTEASPPLPLAPVVSPTIQGTVEGTTTTSSFAAAPANAAPANAESKAIEQAPVSSPSQPKVVPMRGHRSERLRPAKRIAEPTKPEPPRRKARLAGKDDL